VFLSEEVERQRELMLPQLCTKTGAKLRGARWEQSFIQRFLQWTELLDPTNLVVSVEKIEKSRQLLLTNEDASIRDLEDPRIKEAWKRSLVMHPDSSKLIPVPFRPAGELILIFGMCDLCASIFLQISFYTYTTAFNIVNGNASYVSIRRLRGYIILCDFFGVFYVPLLDPTYPLLCIFFFTPTAHISAVNVVAVRSLEPIRGIEVMDKEGHVMGYSRKAGTKAVRDTASSRVVLYGTSAFIPEVFSHYFVRTQFFRQHPWSLWTFKLACTVLVMGLMVPVSFSIFPQIERIQCSELEKEIQSATEDTELFYHRGV
uniref:Sideroflexin 4 n=1 Tax=Canis lupus familiaris TaxID=9615 RepID=A0A8C0PCM5_CANLF